MQKQKIEFPYILHPASPNDNNLQNHSITIKRRRLIKLLIQLQTLFGLHSGGMYFTLVAQTVKNLPAVQETWVPSLGRKDPPGESSGDPLQYSCLENPMDKGAWWATVHGVTKRQTQLSDQRFYFSCGKRRLAG